MAVAITQTADPAGAGSGTTITYSGVSIGTAAHDRVVVVCCGTELSSGTPSSATINYGAGAIAMNASTLGTTGAMGAMTFWLHAPTGTTADIAVTFDASQGSTTQHIAVYSVTGAQGTAASSNGIGDTDADPISSGAITIPSNGGCVAIAVFAADTTARTWTGITEDLDEDAGTFRFTTGTSTTSGTPTITVSGGNNEDGALAWVIFNPNASVERLPAAGNLALSTTAPTVQASTNVSASPAARDLVLSTTAPTSIVDVRLDPAAANLALSTTAPTVQATNNVECLPAAADLVLSTTAPTVDQTANVQADPAAANLVLSTTAPTMAVDVRRDPAAADLVLSTTAPTVEATAHVESLPAAGNLALSTTAPTVQQTENRDITPAAGDLVLSGSAPTVDQTTNVNAQPAARDLVLTTEAPDVTVGAGVVLIPATAQLLLSTSAPSLVVDVRRDPAAANLSLSVVAPQSVVNVQRDPATGQLVFTTVAPSLGLNLAPAARDLALTTTAPTVDVGSGINISPAAGQLVLSSFAPTVIAQTQQRITRVDVVAAKTGATVSIGRTRANVTVRDTGASVEI